MPPADKPTPPDKREQIHRAQLSLVRPRSAPGCSTPGPGGSARPRPSAPDAAPHRSVRAALAALHPGFASSSVAAPRLPPMAIELTTDQARYIARMRSGWPDADIRVHQRPWGVIVEVRRSGRTIALVAFDADGGVHRDAPLRRAA